ncbi:dynactin subunit 6 isoform X1 [Rhagoletis pomonella]|uniref:dynactin subunit 6 isoform X1 n=1 Tax=Rhagoletis pomonella TaxID=28610 RepID=UPI00177B43DB|nr:dynactin subunit 6 isoform X1 [Rhagoletis pomonella]
MVVLTGGSTNFFSTKAKQPRKVKVMSTTDHNDIKIMGKAIVCEDCTLSGDITISPGCVIHPSATIIAEAGPIVLGENCIVEEYSTIAFRLPVGQKFYPSTEVRTLNVGANNVFEVGSTVEACHIGEKNVFESKCYVGPCVFVSSGCIIGAGVKLIAEQKLQENIVLYGRNCLQREAIDKHGSQTLQIDFLRKVLPNYHHLRKPNYDPKKMRIAA